MIWKRAKLRLFNCRISWMEKLLGVQRENEKMNHPLYCSWDRDCAISKSKRAATDAKEPCSLVPCSATPIVADPGIANLPLLIFYVSLI